MDGARKLAGSGAEHAGDVIELARDAGKSRLREADRDGEKADHIGDDHGRGRPGQHEPDTTLPDRPRHGIDALVHQNERR